MRLLSVRSHMLAVTVFVVAISGAAHAGPVTYNAVADFGSSNPSGPWSYGYSSSLPGFTAFSTFTSAYPIGGSGVSGLAAWYVNLPNVTPKELPAVLKNTTGSTLNYATVVHPTGLLNLHPSVSAGALYAVVRFTAPSTDTYNVSALFQGLDPKPTSTDVHVYRGATALLNGTISSYGPPSLNFASTLALNAGDTLDFIVGPNGTASDSFYYDSTGFNATISSVPDPGVSPLVALALGFAAHLLRRRR